MEEPKSIDRPLSRRTLLRDSAGGLGLLALTGSGTEAAPQPLHRTPTPPSSPTRPRIRRFGDRRDWFFEKRFGMFIHWGLHALPGRNERHQWRGRVPRSEDEKLARRWNPAKFDPDQWLDLAEQAGMKYVCRTTKHHDGFCLWDTKQTVFKWDRSVRESLEGMGGELDAASHLTSSRNVLLTRRGNTLYVHLHRDPTSAAVKLKPIDVAPRRATLLNTGKPVPFESSWSPAGPWITGPTCASGTFL